MQASKTVYFRDYLIQHFFTEIKKDIPNISQYQSLQIQYIFLEYTRSNNIESLDKKIEIWSKNISKNIFPSDVKIVAYRHFNLLKLAEALGITKQPLNQSNELISRYNLDYLKINNLKTLFEDEPRLPKIIFDKHRTSFTESLVKLSHTTTEKELFSNILFPQKFIQFVENMISDYLQDEKIKLIDKEFEFNSNAVNIVFHEAPKDPIALKQYQVNPQQFLDACILEHYEFQNTCDIANKKAKERLKALKKESDSSIRPEERRHALKKESDSSALNKNPPLPVEPKPKESNYIVKILASMDWD